MKGPLQVDLQKLELKLAGAVIPDVYLQLACELFDLEPNQVTTELRRAAKQVNYLRIYGQ